MKFSEEYAWNADGTELSPEEERLADYRAGKTMKVDSDRITMVFSDAIGKRMTWQEVIPHIHSWCAAEQDSLSYILILPRAADGTVLSYDEDRYVEEDERYYDEERPRHHHHRC